MSADLEARVREAFAAHQRQVVVPPELLDTARATAEVRAPRWRAPVLLAAAAVVVALALVGALVRSADRRSDDDGDSHQLEVAGTPTVVPQAFDEAADGICAEMGMPALVFTTQEAYSVVGEQRRLMLVLAVADLARLDAPADDVDLPSRVLASWRSAQGAVDDLLRATDEGRLDEAALLLRSADDQIGAGAAALADHGAERCRGVGR